MDVVAEENQEEWLGIQDQASGEVQVLMEAEVSRCHESSILSYQVANQMIFVICIFPDPRDSSHRGSPALATRLISKIGSYQIGNIKTLDIQDFR